MVHGSTRAHNAVVGARAAPIFQVELHKFDHKPQRYGSQVVCKAGVWQPRDLEDPDHVDQRRKAVGLPETEAAYLKYFAGRACN